MGSPVMLSDDEAGNDVPNLAFLRWQTEGPGDAAVQSPQSHHVQDIDDDDGHPAAPVPPRRTAAKSFARPCVSSVSPPRRKEKSAEEAAEEDERWRQMSEKADAEGRKPETVARAATAATAACDSNNERPARIRKPTRRLTPTRRDADRKNKNYPSATLTKS